MTLLLTGFPGTVASPLMAALADDPIPIRVGVRRPPPPGAARAGRPPDVEVVSFDFTDPTTWDTAFAGVDRLFLLRPPQLSRVRRDLLPALAAARSAGVGHVVFLSIQGAERNRVVPHHRVERWLADSGMAWTFVRAAYFMDNLTGTHRADLAAGRIAVPAGDGRTALVDARDVAEVAAAALLDPDQHRDQAWTVTGPEALTYAEVAAVLSQEWTRPVTYAPPSLPAYWRAMRRTGTPAGMVGVTVGIYTAARLGLAAEVTDDVRRVTGRPARTLRAWARDTPDPARG